jgi:hypothetical protein
MANTIVDRTGSPPQTWLLALMYVCFVLNFTASASLNILAHTNGDTDWFHA